MTDTTVPKSLRDWAALPGPAKVLAEARTRMERHGAVSGKIDVVLTGAERAQVGKLLGLEWTATAQPVPVSVLKKKLSAQGTDLRALLERDRPLADPGGDKRRAEEKRQQEFTDAAETLGGAAVDPDIARWLVRVRRPKAKPGSLLVLATSAACVFAQLPGPDGDPVMLATFASQMTGDPHALDKDRELGRFVAALITAHAERADDPDCDLGVRVTAASVMDGRVWRQAWGSQNVLCDEVSSMVLCLNVRLAGTAGAVLLTAAAVSCGEPLWLTLRSLRGHWVPDVSPGQVVYVCENPAVVESAADRIPEGAPLICTFGWPSAAAIRLVEALHDAGATLAVRADDDPAGQRIVTKLLRHAPGAHLWRYSRRPAADAALTPHYEEQVMSALLDDLRPGVPVVADRGDRRFDQDGRL